MSVLVTGATSQIGRFLLPMLMAQGARALALSRQPPPSMQAGVDWLRGSLPEPPIDPVPACILSLGPLPELAEWLDRIRPAPGLRVVAVGSMSAQSKRDSRIAADRELSARLRQAEDRLIAVCERHGAAWTLIRTTMIYGAGLDRNLTPIARRAARWRVLPVPRAQGLRQPVHAEDVAQAVLRAATAEAAAGRILALGGGERLGVDEMFRRLAASLPGPVLTVGVPVALGRGLALAVPRLRGPFDRLQSDLVADNTEIAQLLGIAPRPFRPSASTWALPSA